MDISQNHLHLLKYSQLDTVKLPLGATEGDSGPVVVCNDGERKAGFGARDTDVDILALPLSSGVLPEFLISRTDRTYLHLSWRPILKIRGNGKNRLVQCLPDRRHLMISAEKRKLKC